VLLNASAVGFYGNVPEGNVNEAYPKGSGFLANVCEQWELEASRAQEFGVRVVNLRTGIVLDKREGALNRFLLPFKLFVGGPLGSGDQWFPWIHAHDEVRAILFAMENSQLVGPVNLSAPNPVRLNEFCRALGKTCGRPSWLSAPPAVLKFMFGEMAKPLMLEGQRMIPGKLLDAGFTFRFSNLEVALKSVLSQ
jgi:uncharacterized protein